MLKPKDLPTSFEVHWRHPVALYNKCTRIQESKYWLNPKPHITMTPHQCSLAKDQSEP